MMRYIGRIDQWMAAIAIVCVALLSSCGKSANKSERAFGEPKDDEAKVTVTDKVTKSVEEADEKDDAAVDGAETEDICFMPSNWKKKPVNVSPKGAKANIEDFAQAFCGQYASFEPNRKMLKYLANPKTFDKEAEVYYVESDKANGFIHSVLWTEIDRFTEMCYWNRKNGHQLVGVFIINGSENVAAEPAFMFYDYDPKTHIMTPDDDVCKVVEKVAYNKDFDDYSLNLPQKGKDIVVKLYKDKGDDGYDITEKTLKWTGDTFTQR